MLDYDLTFITSFNLNYLCKCLISKLQSHWALGLQPMNVSGHSSVPSRWEAEERGLGEKGCF